MKVLHVIPSMSPARGGPARALDIMVSALAADGVTVEVATTDDDGPSRRANVPLRAPFLRNGIAFRHFPRQMSFYSFSLPLAVWLWRHVADYDLIHIHAIFSFPSTVAALIAKWRRVPHVVRPLGTLARWSLHNRRPFLKRISLALIESPLLAGADAVHCTSEKEREECAAFRTIVIPNPVPAPVRRASRNQSGGATILFLSRFDPAKGMDILLEAFAKLLTVLPGATLVLAGDGDPDFVAAIRARSETLGISPRTTFAGFLDGDEKQAVLDRADIFVLPSRTENFGIAAVEAMAQGIPVVVSDQVGICRDIARHDAGLITPCDSEKLADAMCKLLQDPDLRSRLGTNGSAMASSLYSPQAVAGQLIALYSRVLSGKPLVSVEPTRV